MPAFVCQVEFDGSLDSNFELFPLDISSIITTSRDNESILLILVPESDSWHMLRMTSHSSAWLSIVEYWEFVHSDRSEIITSNQMLSVFRGINCIDISTIRTLREYTRYFPTEFTCRCLPKGWINQSRHTIWHLNRLFNVVEDLSISLIDSSEELGVSRPIHTNDGGRVDEEDGPVKRVLSFLVDLVDVDGIIMGSDGKIVLVW